MGFEIRNGPTIVFSHGHWKVLNSFVEEAQEM